MKKVKTLLPVIVMTIDGKFEIMEGYPSGTVFFMEVKEKQPNDEEVNNMIEIMEGIRKGETSFVVSLENDNTPLEDSYFFTVNLDLKLGPNRSFNWHLTNKDSISDNNIVELLRKVADNIEKENEL